MQHTNIVPDFDGYPDTVATSGFLFAGVGLDLTYFGRIALTVIIILIRFM